MYKLVESLEELNYGDTFQVLLGRIGEQYWSGNKIWLESTGPGPYGMERAIKAKHIIKYIGV